MFSTSQIQNLTDSTLVRAFVTADCGRGTIDILWSCLTAIFLSVWTVIHLPMPCFDIERPDNSRTKIVRSRTGACVMALFAPELLLYFATVDLMEARQTRTALKRLFIDLSWTHAFFVHMVASVSNRLFEDVINFDIAISKERLNKGRSYILKNGLMS